MQNLNLFVKSYAKKIGGEYVEYNTHHMIIVVPLLGSRFQTVAIQHRKSELYNKEIVVFSSKVCVLHQNVPFESLLKQSTFFNYCRFVIDEGHLKIEAVAYRNLSNEILEEITQEVANLADQYEMKLVGSDVY